MHASDIRIGQNEYSSYQLLEFIKNKQLVLRKDRDWTTDNKSMSIESILLGLSMSVFYFDASSSDEWIVLDGNNRLLSLYEFINNKFKLQGMEFYHKYDGLRFEQLPIKLQRKIEEAEFTVYTINQGVPNDVRLSLICRIVPDLKGVLNWELREGLLGEVSNNFYIKMKEELCSTAFFARLPYDSVLELILEFIKLYLYKQDLIKIDSSYEEILLYFNKTDEKEQIYQSWSNAVDILNNIDLSPSSSGIKYLNRKTIPILLSFFSEQNDDLPFSDLNFSSLWNKIYVAEMQVLFRRKKPEAKFIKLKELFNL